MNPYRFGRGPGYQTIASGVARQGTCENYATAGQPAETPTETAATTELHRKQEEKKRRKISEEEARTAERGTHSHNDWYLNMGTMTGKGRQLADMMERRKINVLCLQETK